jgi:1,4-alpha-glucan branching enzyme
MGWMNDTLAYMREDPIHRQWHHDKMSFGLVYAFSENFLLPLVARRSGARQGLAAGQDARRLLAALRQPARLLRLHVGTSRQEAAVHGPGIRPARTSGTTTRSCPGTCCRTRRTPACSGLVRALNRLYRERPALHALDCEAAGFEWLVADDAAQSVLCWLRRDGAGNEVIVLSNFTPEPRPGLPLRPARGAALRWRVALDSDAREFGGSGATAARELVAEARPAHGRERSLRLDLPPLATLFLVPA